jgi:hypothetical protein
LFGASTLESWPRSVSQADDGFAVGSGTTAVGLGKMWLVNRFLDERSIDAT